MLTMWRKSRVLHLYLIVWCLFHVQSWGQNIDTKADVENDATFIEPSVMVAILVRNKAHILPYFLKYLGNLDYPKQRISLWIRADHNIDDSVLVVKKWLQHEQNHYHSVDFEVDDREQAYSDEMGPCDWSQQRFSQMITLRQQALDTARRKWADFLLVIDCDNLLTNKNSLKDLIKQDKTVVSPLLNATASRHYSNFWGAMDEKGYYKRSEDYKDIQQRSTRGCFSVPMVHSTVLINLRRQESRLLSYTAPPGYQGPYDDIIQFAFSAKINGVPLHILNTDHYGYMQIPMEDHNSLANEYQQFVHMKLENIVADTPLKHLPYFTPPVRAVDKLGFDQVYLINLKRRPGRRRKMEECFKELGIQAKFIDAVDGKMLNDTYLKSIGVQMLPGYADPYHHRPLTMGEIGCFLSHFIIWNEVLEKNYQKVVVFEDDVRFQVYFREKLQYLHYDLDKMGANWELVYLGRKSLDSENEEWVVGSDRLVWPDYSYWTLSYMLSFDGAYKLLQQNPLGKILPVDEYLPIMFNKHPTAKWADQFWPRDLVTLSAWPLLVEPTHYTGEPGYVTDTEDSDVIGAREKGDTGDLETPKDEL